MTILHLFPELNHCCGVSQHICLLSNGLLKSGNRVIVASNGGNLCQDMQKNGITVASIPVTRNTLNFVMLLKTYIALIKLIKKYDVDVVHSHHRLLELIFLLSRPFHRARGVTTCHCLVYCKKYLSYKSERVIAVSDAVRDHLVSYFKVRSSKIRLIHNSPRRFPAIDSATVDKCRTKLGITGKKRIVIGGFGRLHRDKGFDILIDAVKKMTENGYVADCIIAGTGPEERTLKETVRRNKANIHFVGEISDLGIYYAACDIIAVPSRIESAGLVALEAAFYGKPVVASSVGGLVETVIDHFSGLTFETENSQQLCDSLLELVCSEELRENCARNLRIIVDGFYSVDDMVRKTEKLYSELFMASN